MLSRLLLSAAVLVLSFSAHAVAQESAKAKQEDSQMEKQHKSAMKEHLSWQTKIMHRKAEHRSAMAALAQLQADLLKHEAELELMSLKIMIHQNEMAVHEHAIVEHEETGKGAQHDKLKKVHAKFMMGHEKMKDKIDATTSHHKELIDAIMQLIKKHKAKFNEHGMSDSTKPISETEAKILNALKQRVEFNFIEQTWTEIKEQLEAQFDINIVVTASAKDKLTKKETFTTKLSGISLKNALQIELAKKNATFVVKNDAIQIISLDKKAQPKKTLSTKTRSIDSLNAEIAKLRKTRELENASWKQRLADLYSVNKAVTEQFKAVSEQFAEEKRRSHESARELQITNRNFADITAELAKLNAGLAKAKENKK